MPVLKVDRVLLCSPVVWSLCDRRPLLPVYHVVLFLSGEGCGVVEGQLSDLDMCLLPHRCRLPVMPDLQVGGERQVRPSQTSWLSSQSVLTNTGDWARLGEIPGCWCWSWPRAGGSGGGSGLRPYEDSVRVLRPNEVMRGLGGDVLDRTGDIPLHTEPPVGQGGVQEGGRVVESDH